MNARLFAALLTATVETPIVAAFYSTQAWRMAATCLVATLGTNVAMNAWLPRYTSSYLEWLVVGEALAFGLEALAYAAVARPRDFTRAIAASATANAASLGAGVLVGGLGLG